MSQVFVAEESMVDATQDLTSEVTAVMVHGSSM